MAPTKTNDCTYTLDKLNIHLLLTHKLSRSITLLVRKFTLVWKDKHQAINNSSCLGKPFSPSSLFFIFTHTTVGGSRAGRDEQKVRGRWECVSVWFCVVAHRLIKLHKVTVAKCLQPLWGHELWPPGPWETGQSSEVGPWPLIDIISHLQLVNLLSNRHNTFVWTRESVGGILLLLNGNIPGAVVS